ncbi:MAG: glycoside hydrolase family 97 C-terminal domain-containing protein [Balneolaceae bacterium]|nr:glycoside hydrolase family 97 C-terminal domain-containing protein [Balneolaceae bacterium]
MKYSLNLLFPSNKSGKMKADFFFLDNESCSVEIFRDGLSTDRYTSDHIHTSQTISAKSELDIEMVSNGGGVDTIRFSE